MTVTPDNSAPGERPLAGWREIAAHFGRDQSTVKRWAATMGLPVYRVGRETGKRGVPVHAYPSELDAWLRANGRSADSARSDTASPAPLLAGEPTPPAQTFWQRRATGLRPVLVLGAILVLGSAAIPVLQRFESVPHERATASTVSEEARELYLRGTYLWNRRTPEGINGAIETLGRAIALEPDYADAHAGLAMTYNLARQYTGMSGFDAYPLAERHARRAVELDPTSGFAQSVLAFVEFHWLWQVEAGLARFAEALRLDPDSSNTMMWYASSLLHAGRPAEALPLINTAQQSDPSSSAIYNMKALALFLNGDAEAAATMLAEIMSRDPDYAWSYPTMYYIQLRAGDHRGYLENYARLGELIGVERYVLAAEAGRSALEEGGVEAMADAMIAVERDFYSRGASTAWDIARHHATKGDVTGALRWLRTSLEKREERLIGILVDTAFDPIRDDAGFRQVVVDIGLPTRRETGALWSHGTRATLARYLERDA